jgi:two-component system, chemotaxis family, CheB/CheR fusion protein
MNNKKDFYIVGIGASAGGYDALKAFFSQIPEKPGASFVVIQHLDRNFKSLTEEWLSKYTDMKIVTVHDTTQVEPDYIYLMPEDKILRMKDGNLVVSEREPHQAINLSIDIFFQSLGEEAKEKSVGVILSGTGTDGSRGIVTIKENGGIVLVQQPDTAEFDGMPRVAIAVDHPDLIQPPDKLADQLLRYIQNPFQFDEAKLEQVAKTDNNIIQDIIERVSEYSRVNFRGYKINTIIRRIERRTKLNNLKSLSQYHNFLQNNPTEVHALYNDLLIGVTAFFRDPEAFEALEKQVIPALFDKRKSYETVRIWVVACSTGEEAYSIAMLCDEYVQRHQLDVPYKIFATDIDDRSLEVASIGRYSQSIAADISPERLKAYFRKSDDFYDVKKVIRKKIIFARHNLTVDPPFLNINLITCRNLFIYLKPDLQKKIVYNFNFALRSNGYLFLGANETTDSEQELFDTVDAKWKILRSKPEAKSRPHIFETAMPAATAYSASGPGMESRRAVQRSLSQDTRFEEILLQEFAPASILLNSEHEVVYSHGNAERFLQFPRKRMSLNVFHMVSGSMATLFRNGIRKVASRENNLVFRDVHIDKGEEHLTADIFFKVIKHQDDDQQFVLVHFMPASGKAERRIVEEAVNETIPYQEVRELELELEYAKKELLYTVDELETLNQELQATNEEMRSSNEELQSTNEEMQSSNEELHTVNTELQYKLDEISSLHNDISNLVNNTELSIIFLDEELKIRMFTPAAKMNFSFMESDIGRPLSHLSHNFLYYNFAADTRSVLESHRPIEKEIEDNDGHFYFMRVLPYKTERQRIKGVVITFIDITQLKLVATDLQQRTHELEESERNCRTLVSNTPDIIARYNDKLEYIYINEALEKHLGKPASDIIGKSNTAITIPDSRQEVAKWIESVEKAFATRQIVHAYFKHGKGIAEKHFYSSFVPEFCPENKKVLSVLSISREVTELKQHEKLIKEQNKQLKKINNDLDNFVYTASHDLKTPILNIEGLKNILHEKLGSSRDAEETEVMELMDRSISQFKGTINDLTNISKVQKNIQFEEENIALEEVLSDVKTDINSLIVSSGARIEADFQVEHIRYARYYLRSILYNLLSNAIKYRSQEPAEITVQTYREGDAVVLRVTDNGLGLEEAQLPDLFKMFKRFHDHVEGSGIGLYIVNRIVENNEGEIEVESEVGKGTTFRVYFKSDF